MKIDFSDADWQLEQVMKWLKDHEDDMRAAYDLGRDEQLKDDMKWLKENLGEWLAYEDLWDMQTKIGIGMFINDLKRAMRPAQEDN